MKHFQIYGRLRCSENFQPKKRSTDRAEIWGHNRGSDLRHDLQRLKDVAGNDVSNWWMPLWSACEDGVLYYRLEEDGSRFGQGVRWIPGE
jgi:hypothetical protein